MQVNLTAQYDRVIRFGTPDRPTFWPAWSQPGGTLVDLRLFPAICHHCDNTGTEPRETSEYPPEPCSVCHGNKAKCYRPDALRAAGVPETLILEAAASDPMGFVFIVRGGPQ
jgi:hypothetical protein